MGHGQAMLGSVLHLALLGTLILMASMVSELYFGSRCVVAVLYHQSQMLSNGSVFSYSLIIVRY